MSTWLALAGIAIATYKAVEFGSLASGVHAARRKRLAEQAAKARESVADLNRWRAEQRELKARAERASKRGYRG